MGERRSRNYDNHTYEMGSLPYRNGNCFNGKLLTLIHTAIGISYFSQQNHKL